MIPLSLLAAQKVADKLAGNNALATQITTTAAAMNSSAVPISADQVILSAAQPDLGDKNMQLTYPRVCIYTSSLRNTQVEKYRSFSGQIAVSADIWASSDLINLADQWIHIYVQSIAELLRASAGDWGDGFFYPAVYEVQFTAPKPGGVGFVESARMTFSLGASVA